MGASEGALLVTGISLLGIAALGCNLVVAVWTGRPARRVGLAAWLALVLLAVSVLFVQDAPDDVALVASATHELTCEATLEAQSNEARQVGGSMSPACNLWVLIEDPRTGVLWVQGPATTHGATWRINPVLGTEETSVAPLVYRVEILAISDKVHSAWVAAAVGARPIALRARPTDARQIGQGLDMQVGG